MKGLYDKYEVRKDGELESDVFVLKPESDPIALEALRVYANSTDNNQLKIDLLNWIFVIEQTVSE